jgi:hypothetical protein
MSGNTWQVGCDESDRWSRGMDCCTTIGVKHMVDENRCKKFLMGHMVRRRGDKRSFFMYFYGLQGWQKRL